MATLHNATRWVEVVVVIVVVGIVAAIAMPRYIAHISYARTAAIHALAAAVRSSVALVQAHYVASNQRSSPVVLADGTRIAVTTGVNGGIPTVSTTGIQSAVDAGDSFVFSPATGVWNFSSGPIPNCNAVYRASGAVDVNTLGC